MKGIEISLKQHVGKLSAERVLVEHLYTGNAAARQWGGEEVSGTRAYHYIVL